MRKYIENIYDKSNLAISTIHEYASTYMNVSDECCEALRHIDIGYFSLYVMQDYCHRANPQSYKERKERFHRDIQKQEFNNSFKTADLSCLPIRKRILAMLIRGENFFLINFMCRINGVYNKLMYNKK